jgi:hypothetical protein
MVFIIYNACQARTIYQYKNIKTKLMKCCANIYFSRQCLNRKLVPNYANIKVPSTSPASKTTSQKIHIIRIKDEIKFLYKKKQQLNKDLYHIHLKAAQEWGNLWNIVINSINDKVSIKKIVVFFDGIL